MKLFKIALNAGALSKKDGVEKGADAVASALDEFYLSEGGALPFFDIHDITVDNSNITEAHKAVYDEVVKNKGFCVLVGGDHSLTYPAFKAFAKNNPGAGMIVFDAHPDLQEDHRPPTHEDYLRVLIEEGIVDKERVVLIGARNMSKEEKKFMESFKIKSYSMKEISFEGIKDMTDSIMSVARQWPKAYLSIDIDVLDHAFAPGTGQAEPGGLTSRELIYMLQRLKLLRNIGMADVVEVNPEKDVQGITAKAAAKMIVELG